MKRIIILVLAFAAFYAVAYLTKELSPNQGDKKFKETERLLTEIPVHPYSEEVHSSWTSKDRIASASKYYRSGANYDELKNYYIEEITKRGWQYETERQFDLWYSNLKGYVSSTTTSWTNS